MKLTANAHTHTTWCDGKNTAEEMVQAAIAAGFDCIGFSGHSYTAFDESYAMSLAATELYREELLKLRQKYKDQIYVSIGLEWDWYSDQIPREAYDYVIGSVHYIYSDRTGKYYTIDYTPEEFSDCLTEAFDGDFFAMAKAYYTSVADMATQRKPDIIGHLDLLRKLNADNRFFDETEEAYLALAKEAAKVCIENGCIIEINTGGMYKGYRDTPYPAMQLLLYIAQENGKIAIHSDAHDTKGIDFYFPEALQMAKDAGFREVWQLTKQGMQPFSLDEEK